MFAASAIQTLLEGVSLDAGRQSGEQSVPGRTCEEMDQDYDNGHGDGGDRFKKY